MLSEPPSADPHAGWCGGRRGEPGAYPILLAVRATRREAQAALEALRAVLGELGLRLKESKTRIVELRQGGEDFTFLGFGHRLATARTRRGSRDRLPRSLSLAGGDAAGPWARA